MPPPPPGRRDTRSADRGADAPLVFITRKFPPSVGGMETLAEAVWNGIRSTSSDPVLIAHGGSVPATALWLPGALLTLCRRILSGRVGTVLCGDVALYAIIGPLLRWRRVPHAVMAMGLDVTFDHPLYQRIAMPGLRRAPAVLAISEATAEAVRGAGVPADRVEVLTLGLQAPVVDDDEIDTARAELRRSVGLTPDSTVLSTVGRLVPRKGVRWFTAEVVPQLSADVHYLIAGDGPDREAIEAEVTRLGLGERVHLLGRVSDAERDRLMRGADVFVQPNIPVPGDMEGFGLVAIEAAMQGSLVVASSLEGLIDAVDDGVTGELLPAQDATAWSTHLEELLADPDGRRARAQRYRLACTKRSSLEVMAQQLDRTMSRC